MEVEVVEIEVVVVEMGVEIVEIKVMEVRYNSYSNYLSTNYHKHQTHSIIIQVTCWLVN